MKRSLVTAYVHVVAFVVAVLPERDVNKIDSSINNNNNNNDDDQATNSSTKTTNRGGIHIVLSDG